MHCTSASVTRPWHHQPDHAAVHVPNPVGHTTSVEIARQQRLGDGATIGIKRRRDDIHGQGVSTRTLPTEPGRLAVTKNGQAGRVASKLQVSTITRVKANTENSTSRLFVPHPTPGPSQHPLLSLSHSRYGLPRQLIANLEYLGVRAIYPWQSSCLLGKGLLEGEQNLIYTAPTGGGKSLVADILLLKRVIENPGKKGILVLPYVALVQEKLKWLRRVVEGVIDSKEAVSATMATKFSRKPTDGVVRIAGFFGGSKSKLGWSDCDIAVCTIEKANSLVNDAIEDGRIDELGVAVLDELHMLDDEHRGYIMELMMTKLLFLQTGVQIIGMSATLSNPELLANWLQAKFYVSKYRPIPIQEYLVYDNAIYPTANSEEFLRTTDQMSCTAATQKPVSPSHVIAKSEHPELKSPLLNAVVALAVETAVSGFGSLVFCSSRQGVQTIASLISIAMPTDSLTAEVLERRADLIASLQALPNGFEDTFARTVMAGVGFHHAGLTIEERDLVAEAFDTGVLKVMVATCSLAAGINLPARRVILHGARMGRDLVGPAMLRQMRGRAGRKGKDEIGETFMCCPKAELEAVAEMLATEPPDVVSCLTPDKRGIKRAILEVVATRLASSYETLQDYVKRSLLWQTTSHDTILQMLNSTLTSLLDSGLIVQFTENAYVATTLGSAIVTSSLSPDDGLFVYADLRRALSHFVMDTEFYALYLFTPIPQPSPSTSLSSEISWTVYRNLVDSLDEAAIRALQFIGVKPATVNHMANAGLTDLKEKTASDLRTARIYRRAYSTFALRDLCNEVPIHTIALKYNLPRGSIQTLAQTCHGFAAGMIKFCQRMAIPSAHQSVASLNASAAVSPTELTASRSPDPQSAGFSMLAAVLEHMVDRLHAGARADLLEMAQVTFVKGRMARLLYDNGFRNVRALSDADPQKDIVPIMMMVSGWKARPQRRYQQQQQTNQMHEMDNDDDGEQQNQQDKDDDEEERRRKKLEEKLLRKAEVLVASAGRVWERECMRQYIEEE